jgi:hypothetical protein
MGGFPTQAIPAPSKVERKRTTPHDNVENARLIVKPPVLRNEFNDEEHQD